MSNMSQELSQGKRVSVFATNPVRKAIIRYVYINYLLLYLLIDAQGG